jgi:hypothetical protein
MTVLAFDGAVLVRDTGVVAGRCHAVMGAQRLIATRLVEPRIVIEIAECGREAVGTVLERHASKREERVLLCHHDWVRADGCGWRIHDRISGPTAGSSRM